MSWIETMTTTVSWEDLRKKARVLENEVDTKLTTFNKLGLSLGNVKSSNYSSYGRGVEKAPLISAQNGLESLSSEIGAALSALTEVNDQMSEMMMSSSSTNPAMQHTLKRHRDILHDYSNVFQKTRSTIQSRIEREQLLGAGSSRDEVDHFRNGGLNNRRSDGYLKEHEHIKSSDRLLDEQISIAITTKENLQSQRGGMRDIQKKIVAMTKKYPALNSLMQKISIKKRRDSLVIAGVIALCLILMFLYASS